MSKTATARAPLQHAVRSSTTCCSAALPHPILVLADDDRIVYANAAAEAFLSTGIAL